MNHIASSAQTYRRESLKLNRWNWMDLGIGNWNLMDSLSPLGYWLVSDPGDEKSLFYNGCFSSFLCRELLAPVHSSVDRCLLAFPTHHSTCQSHLRSRAKSELGLKYFLKKNRPAFVGWLGWKNKNCHSHCSCSAYFLCMKILLSGVSIMKNY